MDATPLTFVLAACWGVLAAAPLVTCGRRLAVTGRATDLVAITRPDRTNGRLGMAFRSLLARGRASVVGRVLGAVTGRRSARRRDDALVRELPVALDLLGVAVGAGCTPYLAVEVASRWAPPLVAAEFVAVLRSCSLGTTFNASLDAMVTRAPSLAPLTEALLASDRLGAPVAPVLARLATEERAALRRRAEAHARRVPVRLLFPLVFLVLPAFVLLTVVPGLAAGLSRL